MGAASIPEGIQVARVVRQARDVGAAPCHRVHLGAEFCDRLLPPAATVREVAREAADRGLPLTLVTPVCTDEGLGRALDLLDALPAGGEVVINDWGLLEEVRQRGFEAVLGRALVAGTRDPRTADLAAADDALHRAQLRASSLDAPHFRAFLRERGVRRVELDNRPQGYGHGGMDGLRASLHLPDVFVAVTRRCLPHFLFADRDSPTVTVGPCHQECRRGVLDQRLLDRPAGGVVVGNCQYVLNPALPAAEDLARWGVDRVVVDDAFEGLGSPGDPGARVVVGDWDAAVRNEASEGVRVQAGDGEDGGEDAGFLGHLPPALAEGLLKGGLEVGGLRVSLRLAEDAGATLAARDGQGRSGRLGIRRRTGGAAFLKTREFEFWYAADGGVPEADLMACVRDLAARVRGPDEAPEAGPAGETAPEVPEAPEPGGVLAFLAGLLGPGLLREGVRVRDVAVRARRVREPEVVLEARDDAGRRGTFSLRPRGDGPAFLKTRRYEFFYASDGTLPPEALTGCVRRVARLVHAFEEGGGPGT